MPNDDLGLGIEQLTQLVMDQDIQLQKQQKATAFFAEMCALLLRKSNHISPETQCMVTNDHIAAMNGWELAYGTDHTGSEHYLFVKPPDAKQATEQEMIDASRKRAKAQSSGLIGLDGKPITN